MPREFLSYSKKGDPFTEKLNSHTHTHTHTAGGPARGTLCVGRGEERLGDRTVPKAEFLGFILEKSLDNLGLYSGSYSSVLY